MKAFFAAVAALALSSCAFIAPIQDPATFFVVRHFDTPAGVQDPDLTEAGQRRAARLAEHFGATPPATIFVSAPKRSQQTAAPLAAKLGLTPRVYDPADTPGLIAEVLKEPPPVLIVGHSNTVGEIIRALGGTPPGPLRHEDFGDIWTVRAGKTERARIEP